VKKPTVVWCAAMALLVLAGCSSGPTVLGDPNVNEGKVIKTNPGKLNLSYSRYMDNYVTLECEFAARMNTSPKPGYDALLVKHDFGNFYVLVKQGLYAGEIGKLKKGRLLRIYGRVAAYKLPTDEFAKIALVIDE